MTEPERLPKRAFRYDGAVMVFDRMAESRFRAETFAVTPEKARNNIAFQYRMKANIAGHVPVTLPGKLVETKRPEPGKEAEKKPPEKKGEAKEEDRKMEQRTVQETDGEKARYAACRLMRREKGACLAEAVFAVSGRVELARKNRGPYGPFVSVMLTAVLPDRFVEEHFGREYVRPGHRVTFRFRLGGAWGRQFEEHTPRWGQDLVFLLHGMRTEAFVRRSGETERFIAAGCSGFAALGSTRKADGSERTPIRLRDGKEGKEKAERKRPETEERKTPVPERPGAGEKGEGGQEEYQRFIQTLGEDTENDEDLPF